MVNSSWRFIKTDPGHPHKPITKRKKGRFFLIESISNEPSKTISISNYPSLLFSTAIPVYRPVQIDARMGGPWSGTIIPNYCVKFKIMLPVNRWRIMILHKISFFFGYINGYISNWVDFHFMFYRRKKPTKICLIEKEPKNETGKRFPVGKINWLKHHSLVQSFIRSGQITILGFFSKKKKNRNEIQILIVQIGRNWTKKQKYFCWRLRKMIGNSVRSLWTDIRNDWWLIDCVTLRHCSSGNCMSARLKCISFEVFVEIERGSKLKSIVD